MSKLEFEREKAMAGIETKVPSANREIKDGMFKLLFEIPENAAELYSDLKGEECSPEDVLIFTLTTTVSGKQKNDLAIVVRGRALVLGEHMSSPYANMPIRFLMYLGQLYEKWIKWKDEEKFIYGSTLYKIPTPELVVFYNGIANDILADFLRKQGGRIVSILSAEFDIDVARRVWSDEGREEGREEGELAKALAIASKMLKRNRSIDEIMEDTGLTREEVEGLRVAE